MTKAAKSKALFRVEKIGLQTSFQDLGRLGYQKYGVPVSGAMDRFALQAANLLLGNPRGEAALEITMVGPELTVQTDIVAVICGADLNATLNGEPVRMWKTFRIREGDVIKFGKPKIGLRAYLAVAGGYDRPEVMGSQSDYVKAGIGKALQKGELINGYCEGSSANSGIGLLENEIPKYEKEVELRVVPGPHCEFFTEDSRDAFFSQEYIVSPQADRMGYRLDSESGLLKHVKKAEIWTDAVPLGALQVPSNGHPILLMADRQTTGGYPRIGTVITVDLPKAAQLAPGAKIRFQSICVDEAEQYKGSGKVLSFSRDEVKRMITLEDVRRARERIAETIHTTPVMSSTTLSEKAGNEVRLKCEHLQKTGSFKIRGATNKVMDVAEKGARRVVAASSGNHGQAVAYIARKLGLAATIVVPEDAPTCKVEAIKDYGAQVAYGGKTSKVRLEKAEELAKEEGTVLVPPYDDPRVMAGQGTVALEIMEQVGDADVVLVPIGGGGLISGIATAMKEMKPDVKVIGVEPELAKDSYLSRQKGEMVSFDGTGTIADGLRALQPGDLTFPVMQKYLDDLVLVSEEEIRTAFVFLMERMKQVIEPSGAVSVAAAMTNKMNVHGKKVVAVISGGNVALDRINGLL